MLILNGFEIKAQIYESSNSLVYRAIRESDHEPVILKVLKQDYPTPQELVRYRTEYQITQSLHLAGVPKVYDLQKYQNTLVIVLEDFGGESLKIWMHQSRFSIREFLESAIAATEILGQIHSSNIIHKDINPFNIVLNRNTGNLKIIDFGISTQLKQENKTLKNIKQLEGTLAYISPEQTGRMNRSLDYRTDFYSLGVTFYELLTNELPFQTTDALELVHCHIAKQPKYPSEMNREIPQILSDIVMKLMAKTAEERYQKASGIKADLEKCLYQLQNTGVISNFALGEQDISEKFQLPQKLYGRERQIEALTMAFNRSSTEERELMLITGYSGSGKSVLVKELYPVITEKRGNIISGKFDQFQSNIPYITTIRAFQEFVKMLLVESAEYLQTLQNKILDAVGINGQVIIDVIPEIELIIGQQPPAPEIGGKEAQNRFNLVFQNFIKVFTNPECPLTIFLDDLQWADSASLKLLKLLMDEKSPGLFIIGAYRDIEDSFPHPLMLTLQEITKAGGIVNRISLSPLDLPAVTKLIADALNFPDIKVSDLAELVLVKTGGNPFFINHFLKSLYTERLIKFDESPPNFGGARGGWQWDLEEIQAREFTDNVVELMAGKIQNLPENTQQMLKLAACIGNQFDLKTLALVGEKSLIETVRELHPAIDESLVVTVGHIGEVELAIASTEFPSCPLPITNYPLPEYKFVHDRVQQAAYSLIPEEERVLTQYRIGQLLRLHLSLEAKEEQIFAVVNHLNYGKTLIADQTERDDLAQFNLLACRKARLSSAYEAAAQYCETGLHFLGSDGWSRQPNLTRDLYIEGATCASLIGNFERVDELTNIIVQNIPQVLDQIKAVEVQIQSLIARNRLSEAIQIARKILHQLNVELPENPTQEITELAFNEVRQLLAKTENVTNLLAMSNPEKLAAMSILSSMASAAYIGSPALYPLIVLKQVELSLLFGNTLETAYAYSTYGLILCAFGGEIEAGNDSADVALTLIEKFQCVNFKAKILNLIYPFVRIWKEPIRNSIAPLLTGYQAGLESGDLEFAAYCVFNHCQLAYFASENLLQLKEDMQTYGDAISKLKQTTALNFHQIAQQAVLNWMGETEHPQFLVGDIYNENERLPQHQGAGDTYSIGTLYVHKLILTYHFGQPQETLAIAQLAQQAIGGVAGTVKFGIFYFYHGLTLLATISHAQEENSTLPVLEEVAKDLDKLTHWSTYAPQNFAHKCDLIRAEKSRILDHKADAIDLYDKAISGAQENGYLQEEALANELAAKFYLNWGKEKVALVYLQQAYYCYTQWGATAKIKDLEKRYPQLLTASHSSLKNSTTTTGSGTHLDIATVMKASQAIYGEIILDKLLSSLMKTLIENAGAQTGYLILPSQNQFLIEAEGSIDSTISVLQALSISNCDKLAKSIIHYVARTKESVVLDNASIEGKFIHDNYIKTNQIKSILCVPLINQGEVISIVYLENNLTTGAFTSERVEILNFLSAQAAISIKNAKLYTEVRQNESRLNQFLQAIPIGVAVIDINGKPQYINKMAGELLGQRTHGEVTVQNISEVYQNYRAGTNQLYPNEELPIVKALKGEQTIVDDIELRHQDKIINIEGQGTPIYDENGNITHALVAFQDITERKRSEADRQRFTKELFQLNKAYARFVPGQFLQFLDKSSILDVKLGDQVQVEMSVLFSDIRDFTTLSERMTPEENFKFINAYLSRMEPAIVENHGFIDKYIGDAIMALFSGEADHAVKAGISMLEKLKIYNQYRVNSGYQPIQNGIGINTGYLMLGTVGGQNRMDGTVISDAVNLASRVESLTKDYGVSLLITEQTYGGLTNPANYAIRMIDTVKVKGKSQAVTVYEVFDADPPEIKEGKLATQQTFMEAFSLYYQKKLLQGAELFSECLRINPGDRVSKIYYDRCHRM